MIFEHAHLDATAAVFTAWIYNYIAFTLSVNIVLMLKLRCRIEASKKEA